MTNKSLKIKSFISRRIEKIDAYLSMFTFACSIPTGAVIYFNNDATKLVAIYFSAMACMGLFCEMRSFQKSQKIKILEKAVNEFVDKTLREIIARDLDVSGEQFNQLLDTKIENLQLKAKINSIGSLLNSTQINAFALHKALQDLTSKKPGSVRYESALERAKATLDQYKI